MGEPVCMQCGETVDEVYETPVGERFLCASCYAEAESWSLEHGDEEDE